MKISYLIGGICLSLFSVILKAENVKTYIIPDVVNNVAQHQISLNGKWQFQYNPNSKWTTIEVPGEAAMQGYAIEHDKPVIYKKQIIVPADYSGKKTILRFDGVYSHARLWVNNIYVREHFGGFTRWEADVTSIIKPGRKNEIKLEVVDRIDDISYASGYAHHPIGGILRDVTLYSLPNTNLSDLKVETNLDDKCQNAVLNLSYNMSNDAEIEYILTDPNGKEVSLGSYNNRVKAGVSSQQFPISNPMKWDAEHPNLYTLSISIRKNGSDISRLSRNIGFRSIKIDGNRMLVNGKPVKLRGACRHDIHPTLGRTVTAEIDSLDAVIFKQTNMNFVRTSHYPPTERFLEYCDKLGIYVECETAICFVETHRQKNYAPAASQNDSSFTDKYLVQLEEMINTLSSHASILFWSIGNESNYGINFQKSYDWIKSADKTRPAIFSYPGSVGKETKCYDILSMHYPGVDGTLNQWGIQTFGFQVNSMPSIFDEWAHVPCYTYTTLQDDPNIREFWGASLDMMWSKLFDAQGGLGGAIWGYTDETFMLPAPKVGVPFWKEFARTAKPLDFQGKSVGYGEWGVVDVWRREKPEYWSTKKAYSPIRIMQTQINDFSPNMPLQLAVYNRFDHTNLNEVRIVCNYNGKLLPVTSPEVAPHEKGYIEILPNDWKSGDNIVISFYDINNMMIDAEEITIGEHKDALIGSEKGSLINIKETDSQIIVEGNKFSFPFDKTTGLINNATSNGKIIVEKGPFINLDLNFNHNTGAEVREKAKNYIVSDSDWKKESLSAVKNADETVLIDLTGSYKNIKVKIQFMFKPNGTLAINYTTSGEPNGYLRESGLKFYLPETIERLGWKRKGYWSFYPENSFAGNEGSTLLYNSKLVEYGDNPNQSWNLDTHNYYYFADAGALSKRPLTNMAKGMKENIYNYILSDINKEASFNILSPSATLGCRLNKISDEQLILYVNTRWDYPEIAWGDYCKALDVTPNFGTIFIELK